MGQGSSSKSRIGAKGEQRDDVKRQIDSDLNDAKPIYQLVNVKTGGGKLIELIKERARHAHSSSLTSSSSQPRDSSSEGRRQQEALAVRRKSLEDSWLDEQITGLVKPLLYNEGRGKWVPLERLWCCRFGKDTLGADDEEEGEEEEEVEFGDYEQGESRRLVCWKLEERGFVGETALHICFLLSTPGHMILAQKLLRLFPRLINDIYTCDEYFGESSLHMAIVNENVKIVKLLLDHGANVHERCLGSFFLPHDQKARANQRLRHELLEAGRRRRGRAGCWGRARPASSISAEFDLHSNQLGNTSETNYDGYTYWGEYPLSFAASLGLRDCYQLLLAKGANPNRRDSNGNTTLHICVIANKPQMFDLCYSMGADLNCLNKLGLSPLSLAAKLRRFELFEHILELQRQVSWIFCNVGFLDYPLQGIDSVNSLSGACDDQSLLSIVVSGSSNEHLKMLDGLLSDLLQVKWETSLRHRFRLWLAMFALLLLIATLAYITRFTFTSNNDADDDNDRAPKLLMAGYVDNIRLLNQLSELALIACVLYYLLILLYFCLIDARSQPAPGQNPGREASLTTATWRTARANLSKTLAQAPELSIFTLTCLLILTCIPLRMLGLRQHEDALVSIIMFMLPLFMLFFCRGSKSLGSFIVMIYKILVNDVLCFFVFLVIFISGFAQSFVIIFKTYRPRAAPSSASQLATMGTMASVGQQRTITTNSNDTTGKAHLGNLFESIVRGDSHVLNLFDALITMHMMALNEFSWVLDEFEATDYPGLARVLFCAYMILVSILLINMLIAMLGKTYQDISSQPNENLRQWARALLTLERLCSRSSRLKMLDKYSHLVQAQQRSSRCFSSTWALKRDDLDKLNATKRLKRDQAANERRLLRRAEVASELARRAELSISQPARMPKA